jgi:hypothetical protein
LGDHVRDPKSTPDLDELTARDDDSTSGPPEGSNYQQDGAGTIVDGERVVGTGELAQRIHHVGVAGAPPAAHEIQLDVAVAARACCNGIGCDGGERRSTEVGVHNDTGAIQYASKGRGKPRASPCSKIRCA